MTKQLNETIEGLEALTILTKKEVVPVDSVGRECDAGQASGIITRYNVPTETLLAIPTMMQVIREQKQLINDYEEVLEDKRCLAREIDVALHGEKDAAIQASLCDLVSPARELKAKCDEQDSLLDLATREFQALMDKARLEQRCVMEIENKVRDYATDQLHVIFYRCKETLTQLQARDK